MEAMLRAVSTYFSMAVGCDAAGRERSVVWSGLDPATHPATHAAACNRLTTPNPLRLRA